MIKFILILLVVFLFSCNSRKSDVIDKTHDEPMALQDTCCNVVKRSLNDFRASSSYIRVRISNPSGQEKLIIVENSVFFDIYSGSSRFTQSEYSLHVFKKIKEDEVIHVNDGQFERLKVFFLENETTDNIEQILSDYFENNIQKEMLPNNNVIISKLIKNDFQVSIDDESGYLMLFRCS